MHDIAAHLHSKLIIRQKKLVQKMHVIVVTHWGYNINIFNSKFKMFVK